MCRPLDFSCLNLYCQILLYSWRKDNGPLVIKAINTRGDEDGWVQLNGGNGVHVAEVVDDIDPLVSSS